MKVTLYSKNILVAVSLLALFVWVLNLALDFRRGVVVGMLALVAYLVLETGLTFNPATWWRSRRP
jgi:uncharacterized membrane protein AbrB (regulator of aidB expression)